MVDDGRQLRAAAQSLDALERLVDVGLDAAGYAVFAIMTVFATLESVFALCVGCQIFALLIRAGLIPEEVCEACADISLRRA